MKPEDVKNFETNARVSSETKRHVLVVDDSALQRRILSSLLARWGYEVTEARSGKEALHYCRTAMPDLILSDWMMPGMSGLEFCEILRELQSEDYAYFILLTSKTKKAEVAKGLDAGADDFLSKPVDTEELRARINAGERILNMRRELSESNKLISVTLEELQRVYDAIDHDLQEARNLQQSLLRERVCDFGVAQLSMMLRPSGHVGGDLVGYYPAGPNHLGFFGLDVSGHGLSSALFTARLAGYLSSTAPDLNVALKKEKSGEYALRPPAQVIADLNELVQSEIETDKYFTLMIANVDLRNGHVALAQAGHPHPLVQRANGDIEQSGPGGFPVGLMPGVTFEQFEIQLAPGDRLLVLSDGVTECPDPAEQLLDEAGLERIVRDLSEIRGRDFLDALVAQLADYAGGDEFPDDISGLLFEYWGSD